ncbi:hypothetical protein GALMADRAFT_210732 [Galerina marginata CBS 339.88]|uniref:Extracellular membrane protein CFEM domain-containing protein n=1 Tax=Galerina marginata (strain CBS 339.88) TaxID=685588 RepID=A0A067SYL0_GALM3|nr:hypothetical protein GALMADRAFT_210732 [Galerina marginata CBS 339.88]
MVAFRTLAASVLVVVPAVLADPFTSPAGLYARQISGFDPSSIPASCIQQQCQSFVNTVTTQGCSTLDCLCTNSVVGSLKSCIQCAVDAGIAGYNQTTANDAVTGFVSACNSAGHSVSVSGSGSSGSSGSSSSASAAAPGASSASTTTTTKSGAVVGMGISVVGSILALALGGVNFA